MAETSKPKRTAVKRTVKPKAKPAAGKAPGSAKELYANLVSLIHQAPKATDKKAGAVITREALAALKVLKDLLDKAEKKLAGIKKLAQ
jgi:hypothetical protein